MMPARRFARLRVARPQRAPRLLEAGEHVDGAGIERAAGRGRDDTARHPHQQGAAQVSFAPMNLGAEVWLRAAEARGSAIDAAGVDHFCERA